MNGALNSVHTSCCAFLMFQYFFFTNVGERFDDLILVPKIRLVEVLFNDGFCDDLELSVVLHHVPDQRREDSPLEVLE